VYKIKYNSNGSIERCKARLVILGNNQVEGIDYYETFAPTVKMATVHTFLMVAVAKNWELHQMDVHNTFLHGDLTEEVYMHMPPGFASPSPGKACRLRKSLYGLHQSPHCWFAKLAASLTDMVCTNLTPTIHFFLCTTGMCKYVFLSLWTILFFQVMMP
jgi:hypothetical protein